MVLTKCNHIKMASDLIKTSYKTEFEIEKYQKGRMYEIEMNVPRVGLVIMENNSGFGDGSTKNFIVTKVFKNKKNVVNRAELSRVKSYDEITKILNYDPNDTITIVQSYDKSGDWKYQGDSEAIMYYFRFGEIGTELEAFYR